MLKDKLIQKFSDYGPFRAIVVFGLFFLATYLITNHLTWIHPWQLPLFSFERSLPFMPWTVFVYLSTFPVVVMAIPLFSRRDLPRAMAAMISMTISLGIIFLLFPTIYPRPVLPTDISPFTEYVYRFFTAIDTARNCFPSEHVAGVLLVSFILLRRNRAMGAFFLIWSVFIAISTLTVKQHYVLDLVGGVAVAVIFYYFFFIKKSHDAR